VTIPPLDTASAPASATAGSAEAARQLEVTFLTQLLQAMRKTVPESEWLPRSAEKDVYDGAFDRSVAEALSARDPLGIMQSLGQSAGPGLKSDTGTVDMKGGTPRSTV